jgi:hypothetical protein
MQLALEHSKLAETAKYHMASLDVERQKIAALAARGAGGVGGVGLAGQKLTAGQYAKATTEANKMLTEALKDPRQARELRTQEAKDAFVNNAFQRNLSMITSGTLPGPSFGIDQKEIDAELARRK